MSRVYNDKMIEKFESCVLHRFKGLRDLKGQFNQMFSDYDLKVKEIAKKKLL